MSSIKRPEEVEAIQDCTEFFLKNPHSVKKWLTLVDKYMQTLAKEPEMFLMPKAHDFLQPLVESYATDTEGFTQYLVYIRDSFSKSDLAWEHVQSAYRKINGRYVQQVRRERSNRACVKAEELYGPTDYHSRLQWVADLEHSWAQRRLAFLEKHRSDRRAGRLDTETRAELLVEFWKVVDTEIKEGREIPPWN
mgnify:FL=1